MLEIEKKKQILQLRKEGLSYKEIANKLNCSTTAVAYCLSVDYRKRKSAYDKKYYRKMREAFLKEKQRNKEFLNFVKIYVERLDIILERKNFETDIKALRDYMLGIKMVAERRFRDEEDFTNTK